MAEISITGPHEGEVALSGPAQMRILEDGSTTSHRLGHRRDHHRPAHRRAAAAPARPA